MSLGEILVVLVVAILVVRPERWPQVALKIGRFVQSTRQFIHKLKKEMDSFISSSEQTHDEQRKS